MSYTTIKYVNGDGDVYDGKEFRNSHYAPVIWKTLYDKYIPNLDSHFFMCDDRLWDLQYSYKLSNYEWYVFLSTFDRIIVPPELFSIVSESFSKFVPYSKDCIDHSKGYIDFINNVYDLEPTCRGICWYTTSLIEDPWYIEDDENDENDRLYNIDIDDNHYFMTKREDWHTKE
jgi:hypothetical protein